jgi:hypothetical protein
MLIKLECANSSACKEYKNHFDHCAHRVEEQTEKFGKPQEDCVEECEYLLHRQTVQRLIYFHSLPSCSLRLSLCSSTTLERTQVNDSSSRSNYINPCTCTKGLKPLSNLTVSSPQSIDIFPQTPLKNQVFNIVI